MTRTAGAPIGCQRPSRFWGLGCPKIYHEVEDTLVFPWQYCRAVPAAFGFAAESGWCSQQVAVVAQWVLPGGCPAVGSVNTPHHLRHRSIGTCRRRPVM
nr:hypothetical protein [Thiolapillus sp.]